MDYKLPPLPTTLAEILQVLSRESPVPDDQRLVTIIEKDPAISIYVLRQVNSAYYSLRRQVSQIHRAVTLLGLKRVCNLVLAAALKQAFPYLEDKAAQRVFDHINKTSIATAAFARELTTHLHLPFFETAFTSGLLHQLGRLVFLYSAPTLYVPLWYEQGQTPVAPSPTVEQAHFDTDFLQLGASSLRKWGLPDVFATVVAHLHTPEQVSESALRSLTLTVATGSAASRYLYATDAEHTSTGQDVALFLEALAQTHHVEAEALAVFLDERSASVRQFAESVMGDI